jgi:hypothetical protein
MTDWLGIPALLFGAMILGFGACAADSRTPASESANESGTDSSNPPTVDLLTLTGLKPPWAMTRPISTARFYMDRSKSMAGYVRESGGPLDDFAGTLGRALLQHDLRSISGAGFGTRVEQGREIGSPAEALEWEANAATTCLVSPINAQRTASKKGGSLLVLMTDGVVSASGGSCGAKCADSDEVSCVAQALFEYLQAGNGLWVIGVRVPYTGQYYPALRPGSFSVASAQRPIYLWIGGPNAQVGRAIAERMVKWAIDRQPSLDHMAIEVWPGHWDESRAIAPRGSTWSPWSARLAAEAIAGWSTTDDTELTEITKTLGFERLWVDLLTRLESIRRTLR